MTREKSFIHQFSPALCLRLNRRIGCLVYPHALVRLGSHQVADQTAEHRMLYLGIGCLVYPDELIRFATNIDRIGRLDWAHSAAY